MNPNSTKWLGTGLQELYKEIGPWNYCQEVVAPSKCHHVLYQLPVLPGVTPKPRYNKEIAWDNDHVRMPYSPNNLYPVEGVSSYLSPLNEVYVKYFRIMAKIF